MPPQDPAPPATADECLAGGGELGALARGLDWGATPLGPVSDWPQSLRTSVSTCLSSRFPILIWWGPELVKIYNDAYKPILGAKHPRALGARGRDVWPEIWAVIGPMLEGVLSRGEATWSEDQLLLMDRHGFLEETYFTFSYSPIRAESGGVGGVFCAVNETTGRVLSERRLRRLRELAGVTGGAGSVAEAARLAAQALAADHADLPFARLYLVDGDRPRPVDGRPEPDHDDPWDLARALASGQPHLVERVPAGLSLPPGVPTPRGALVLPIRLPELERPAALLVAGISARLAFDRRYRDFLELTAGHIASALAGARAREEVERRAAALAELDRAKTAFFSNVSHEFRTPLTLLLGPTEDLLCGRLGELAAPVRGQLELLRRNALRLQRLVNALLEFSRLEAGRAQAAFTPTDLGLLTRELASSFRSAIERAGLLFEVECPSLGEPVWVDRDMWEQVMLNLLSNALKFTFSGQITVRLAQERAHARLEVTDTGVGVRAQDLPRLFERFHRVEGERARTHEGSGIGLALVDELVRLHGGTIEARSEYGRGTSFLVRLPLGHAHLPADRLRAEAPPVAASSRATAFLEEAQRWVTDEPATAASEVVAGPAATRILVADDNADMRDYLRRILGARWPVECVTNGEEALAAARRARPALVLTDAMMPVLDGFGLLRALRADPGLRDLPVVMLSARAGEEARVEGLTRGADDYLIKPFSAPELVARVSTRLELAAAHTSADRQWREAMWVLGQTPVALSLMTMPERRFVYANAEHVACWGRDVTGLSLEEAFPDLSPEELQRARARQDQLFAADGAVLLPEVRLVTSDGRVRWLDVSGRAWSDMDGVRRGIVVATVDVTERVEGRARAEEAHARLVRSEAELRLAQAARDEFLSLASHELRTPLTTIGLQTETLLRSLQEAEAGDARVSRWCRRVERLRGQSLRLERLIEGMLDVLSLSPERLRLDATELDLAAVVEEVVVALQARSSLARRAITLRTQPAVGRWDRPRLEQLLGQLLDNALKFGNEQPIDVVVLAAGDRVRLIVTDRGIGIAEADQARIFQRLERAVPADQYGGFGLGLWIVAELVRAMNGQVRVESRPGSGASFVVELPRSP